MENYTIGEYRLKMNCKIFGRMRFERYVCCFLLMCSGKYFYILSNQATSFVVRGHIFNT